jgi:polyisoprenoid-binding protein YceI
MGVAMIGHGAIKCFKNCVFILPLLVLASVLLGCDNSYADNASYYAPPSQMNATMLLSYGDSYSQDYVALNPNPPARFTSATAAFFYDRSNNSLTNLRAAFTSGSITSPDRDYTWILLNRSALDVNNFDEISLTINDPVAMDKNLRAVTDAMLTLRGTTNKVPIEIAIQQVEAGSFAGHFMEKSKAAITISLSTEFKGGDLGMAPVDSENRSRGDKMVLKMAMRAVKQ